jgi:CBS-domain-containing membrane protein
MTTMNAVVRDIMTTPVVTVRPDTAFKEMAAKLREQRISAFPVVDDSKKVIGIVSEADLLAKEALAGDQNEAFSAITRRKELAKAGGLTAGDLMSRSVVTVSPRDPVEHAARLVYALRVKRLPVVDSGGVLAGIITRSDVLAVYDRPDDEIRTEIVGTMVHRFLIDPGQFTVTVEAGVVTLAGRPETAELGHALAGLARDAWGVVAVHDCLSYPGMYPVMAGPVL